MIHLDFPAMELVVATSFFVHEKKYNVVIDVYYGDNIQSCL